jgi:hypothetical protein
VGAVQESQRESEGGSVGESEGLSVALPVVPASSRCCCCSVDQPMVLPRFLFHHL